MTSENQGPWNEDDFVRLFIITGEPGPEAKALNLVTLIATRAEPGPDTQPEQAAILTLCDYPLSVAELSAYLGLPFSVVTVLLTQLVEEERVEAIAPVPVAAFPERGLLEAVIHGLRKL
ncbi:DUF742 domain-containing protein [Streptomyces sp. NPDC058664]|uniref:DUF742 domain-containing protein n=1 Tax=unclassified Streptomyces TaxID=2593676 RepID=UPI00365E9B3F